MKENQIRSDSFLKRRGRAVGHQHPVKSDDIFVLQSLGKTIQIVSKVRCLHTPKDYLDFFYLFYIAGFLCIYNISCTLCNTLSEILPCVRAQVHAVCFFCVCVQATFKGHIFFLKDFQLNFRLGFKESF